MASSGSQDASGGFPIGGTFAGQYGPTFGFGSRHGTAERGYGGNFGITPPTSPPRRSNTPTRRADRSGRGFMREPSTAGTRRERSRDRSPSQAARNDDQPLPGEWGGRTLRTERLIGELTGRVNTMEGVVTQVNNRIDVEHNRLNALETALPQRMHNIEERQAAHIELVNNLSR